MRHLFWCLWEFVELSPVGMVARARILVQEILNVCVTRDSRDLSAKKILIRVHRHRVCMEVNASRPELATTHVTAQQECPESDVIMVGSVHRTRVGMEEFVRKATMAHCACVEDILG